MRCRIGSKKSIGIAFESFEAFFRPFHLEPGVVERQQTTYSEDSSRPSVLMRAKVPAECPGLGKNFFLPPSLRLVALAALKYWLRPSDALLLPNLLASSEGQTAQQTGAVGFWTAIKGRFFERFLAT